MLYIYLYLYFLHRTQATKEYIQYSQQHRKILEWYWHRWSSIYCTLHVIHSAKELQNKINTCSSQWSQTFFFSFLHSVQHMKDVQETSGQWYCIFLSHAHTHARFTWTGLSVKGNQIQKGSSQLVLKVDSTCKDLLDLWISSEFTLGYYSSINVQTYLVIKTQNTLENGVQLDVNTFLSDLIQCLKVKPFYTTAIHLVKQFQTCICPWLGQSQYHRHFFPLSITADPFG